MLTDEHTNRRHDQDGWGRPSWHRCSWGTSVGVPRETIMLTNTEAAEWRRCGETVSAAARGLDCRSQGSCAGRGQALIQATRPRRIKSTYPAHDQSKMISPWPALASLRSEWSRAGRAGRRPGPEPRPGLSWDFFSSASRARSMLRGWTTMLKCSRTNSERAVGRSNGSRSRCWSRKSTTRSESLWA